MVDRATKRLQAQQSELEKLTQQFLKNGGWINQIEFGKGVTDMTKPKRRKKVN